MIRVGLAKSSKCNLHSPSAREGLPFHRQCNGSGLHAVCTRGWTPMPKLLRHLVGQNRDPSGHRSVSELPVLVLAEQSHPDGRQSLGLEELQALLEGVVDVDPSASANNHATTSSVLR
jgi:hypothetical protein